MADETARPEAFTDTARSNFEQLGGSSGNADWL
jgi:hypothetical protein